ncbi:hypothetical protein COOONC_01243 [Cooperia oncophora]
MLVLNQDFRLTPLEGLEHKFVTMSHLHAYTNTNYFRTGMKRMEVCVRRPTAVVNSSAQLFRGGAPATPIAQSMCNPSSSRLIISNAATVKRD